MTNNKKHTLELFCNKSTLQNNLGSTFFTITSFQVSLQTVHNVLKKKLELFFVLMMHFINIFCSPNHTL